MGDPTDDHPPHKKPPPTKSNYKGVGWGGGGVLIRGWRLLCLRDVNYLLCTSQCYWFVVCVVCLRDMKYLPRIIQVCCFVRCAYVGIRTNIMYVCIYIYVYIYIYMYI